MVSNSISFLLAYFLLILIFGSFLNILYENEPFETTFEKFELGNVPLTIVEEETDQFFLWTILDWLAEFSYNFITSIPLVGDIIESGLSLLVYGWYLWTIFTYDPNIAIFTYFVLLPATLIAVFIIVTEIFIPIVRGK